MILAPTGTVLLTDQAQAGTPVMGDIVANTIWSPAGSPYWIEADITVLAGVELLVQAGAEVRFDGFYSLDVLGRLIVEGNVTDPVIFTSNSSTPSVGDWIGILVGGETHINYANISYGYVGIYIQSSHNTVNDSIFYRDEDAVFLDMGADNLIRNNTLYNSTYCGIVTLRSDSNEIIGNNATRSGDTGICLYESSGNLIQQNTLYQNYWNGIRLSPLSYSNVIVENTILESQLYQGIGIWSSDDNFILNNTIRRNNNNGIYLQSSSGNNISWNEISDSVNYHGVSTYLASSNVMIGNHIHGVWRDGFYMETSFSNRLFENDIHDNDNGIYMYDADWSDIARNNITGNSVGIRAYLSSGIDILSNNVSGNTGLGFGVYLLDSSNNVDIIGNIITWNLWNGVAVVRCDGDVIADNQIARHLNEGIHLRDSSNVTITGNNVTINGLYGVYVHNSSDITVYHNNLIGNIDNAYDDGGSENKWDDGYPSGGNYWDDYTGIDFFSGPNQNIPGSEYLGDEPYVIDPDSRDNYPLMYPFGMSPSLKPSNLTSELSGKDLENVTLTWELSGDDSTGRGDVVSYSVFRSAVYDPSGLGYSLLVNVTNGTSIYVDSLAGEGDPDSYFYRVCAVNLHSIPSCADGQAAKFTRLLAPGPNLISIPLAQSDESVETVLQTLNYDEAWFYDSSNGEWKWHMTFKDYRRGLWNVNHTMGIWVNVTEASNLTVAGMVPANTTIQLRSGWDLVGFPSFNLTYTVADLKAEVGATRVEGFYAPGLPHCLRILEDFEVLQAGYAYWMKVDAAVDWIVEAS